MDYITRRVTSDFNGEGGGAGRRRRTIRQGFQLAGRMFTDCVEESTYFDILLCTAIFIIFTCFFFWLGIRFGTALIPEDDLVLIRARRTAVKVEPLKTNLGLLQALGYTEDGRGDRKQVQGVKSDTLYISQDSQVKTTYIFSAFLIAILTDDFNYLDFCIFFFLNTFLLIFSSVIRFFFFSFTCLSSLLDCLLYGRVLLSWFLFPTLFSLIFFLLL